MSISDFKKSVDKLKADHVQNFDPVRFAYIQGVSLRLATPQQQKNLALIEKAINSAEQYLADLDQYRAQVRPVLDRLSAEFPPYRSEAETLFEQCYFKKLEQLSVRLNKQQTTEQSLTELRALTRGLNQEQPVSKHAGELASIDDVLLQQEQSARLAKGEVLATKVDGSGEQLELQSMKYFRESMKHFNIDKIIARAIDEGPENPGPLNSQMLAIKSLTNMRDLSPEYLRRFAAYIETLLWLEKSTTRLNSKNTA